MFNNVMLSSILGIVLLGTLYPLMTEALGEKVSVGPPYFTPMSAVFAVPMILVMMVFFVMILLYRNLKVMMMLMKMSTISLMIYLMMMIWMTIFK